jgi:hypothetical protein
MPTPTYTQALAPKILKFLPKIIGSHALLNPFWGVSTLKF